MFRFEINNLPNDEKYMLFTFLGRNEFFHLIAKENHTNLIIVLNDKRDAKMPDVGLVRLHDLETGKDIWLDTSSKSVRKAYDKAWYERQQNFSSTTARCGVDSVSVATDEDYVKALIGLFRRRG